MPSYHTVTGHNRRPPTRNHPDRTVVVPGAGPSTKGSTLSKPFSEDARQEFLAGKHIAVISIATDDGRPPVSVPIWYGYEPGGNILINTSASGRKARLLEKAGAVTVVVQQEEMPYQYVIVEGTILDITTPTPYEAREKIAIRYLGEEDGKKFSKAMPGEGSALYTIRPDRWITADFTGEL